jgi:adenylylsulfate kinase-like enzyme
MNMAALNALESGHCFICYDSGVNETRNGHKPAILWLTGLSGSGKSTTAKVIKRTI